MPPHGPGFSGGLHSHDAEFPNDDWNLYSMIDLEQLSALNVTTPTDAAGIFRPFPRRLNELPILTSNCDEEMIITIPFSSPCHVRKMMFIGGGEDAQHPLTIKAYTNRDNITFGNVNDLTPVQVFDNLPVNSTGTAEVVTALRPFTNINTLTLYITANHGFPTTVLRYVGMQGEHTHYRREAIHADYEVICHGKDINAPADVKVGDNFGV